MSHDREFLQGLTQKVYEFKNQNIKEYTGDINAFLSEKELDNFKQLETSQKDQKIVIKDKKIEKDSYQDKKTLKSNIKKLYLSRFYNIFFYNYFGKTSMFMCNQCFSFVFTTT